MEYILGLRNRKRYITNKFHFLSEKFDPHELLVYSTNKNRTILSMASQLQGLYPISSKKGEILNPKQIKNALPQVNISSNEIQLYWNGIINNSYKNLLSMSQYNIVI